MIADLTNRRFGRLVVERMAARRNAYARRRMPRSMTDAVVGRAFTFCRKRGYDTSSDAAKAAVRRLRFAKDTDHLRIYFCDWCSKWHMTKQKVRRTHND